MCSGHDFFRPTSDLKTHLHPRACTKAICCANINISSIITLNINSNPAFNIAFNTAFNVPFNVSSYIALNMSIAQASQIQVCPSKSKRFMHHFPT
jgi:hypothetical protein